MNRKQRRAGANKRRRKTANKTAEGGHNHANLADAWRHFQDGRLPPAEALCRGLLEAEPDNPDANHLLGSIAQKAGHFAAAADLVGRAVAANPGNPIYHAHLGDLLQALGNHVAAMAAYRRAIKIKPDFAEAQSNLGNARQALGKIEDAIAAYRRAIEIRPDFADAHYNLGNALKESGKFSESISAYQRAIEIIPDSAPALGNLAALYESVNRLDEAGSTVARGLDLFPEDPLLNLTAAKLERRRKRYRQAIARLAGLPRADLSPAFEMGIHFELGQLHDRTGDSGEAFAHFSEANRLQCHTPQARNADKNRYLREIEILSARFTPEWVDSWTPTPPLDGQASPLFLIGFPRTGTTLLEHILAGHPRLRTIEEQPTISEVRREISTFPGGYPRALAGLAPARIEHLRSIYFQAVDRFIDRRAGDLFVDKMPLNIVEAGLIWRLFPAAKFIVTVRHPCDVCLSCFMQAFDINDPMANFFSLKDSARLYAEVMELWRRYPRVLPLIHHVVRYEDLVEDLEGEARRLVEFLGLEWDPAVLGYAERAKRRGKIQTPSYHQVTEPIYRRARYRWRRYAEHLRPVMATLAPYIEEFGY